MRIHSQAFGTLCQNSISLEKLIPQAIEVSRIAIAGGVQCGRWYWSGGDEERCPWSRPISTFRSNSNYIEVFNWENVKDFCNQLDEVPSVVFVFSDGSKGGTTAPVLAIAHQEDVIGIISLSEIDVSRILDAHRDSAIDFEFLPQIARHVFGWVFENCDWLNKCFDAKMNLSIDDFHFPNAPS